MELSERLKKIDEAALKALAPVFADFDRMTNSTSPVSSKIVLLA